MEGVEGYVVCNNEGTVLRHQADMDKKVAEELAKVCCGVSPRDKIKSGLATSFALLLLTLHYPQHHLSISISFSSSQNLTKLASRATNVARDLDPNDDLRLLRIKTARKEVIVSHEKEFIVIVLQQWKQAEEKDV